MDTYSAMTFRFLSHSADRLNSLLVSLVGFFRQSVRGWCPVGCTTRRKKYFERYTGNLVILFCSGLFRILVKGVLVCVTSFYTNQHSPPHYWNVIPQVYRMVYFSTPFHFLLGKLLGPRPGIVQSSSWIGLELRNEKIGLQAWHPHDHFGTQVQGPTVLKTTFCQQSNFISQVNSFSVISYCSRLSTNVLSWKLDCERYAHMIPILLI